MVTSKNFPSHQHQELHNFIKGLQLPPDVCSLFTTVRNERVAERKAALGAHSQEDIDGVLQLYGSRFHLLTQATSDLGLAATTSLSPHHFGHHQHAAMLPHTAATCPTELPLPSMLMVPAGSDGGATSAEETSGEASQPWRGPLRRNEVTEGVRQEAAGAFTVGLDVLPSPAFITDAAGVVRAWNVAMAQLTGHAASAIVGQVFAERAPPRAPPHHSFHHTPPARAHVAGSRTTRIPPATLCTQRPPSRPLCPPPPTRPPAHLSCDPPISLSSYPPISLSSYPPIHLSTYPPIHLSTPPSPPRHRSPL